MTSAIFHQGRPLTEGDYLALGETSERVELFDGSLFVTPAPTPRHQHISRKLANALDEGATDLGLNVMEAVNVRLQPGRIPIPDVVITSAIDFDEVVIDAEAVLLVSEIISPSSASVDKVLKMHNYASAGIPWYLLIEQDRGSLHLYQLQGQHYVEHSITKYGEVLHLFEPVNAYLDTTKLLPPQ